MITRNPDGSFGQGPLPGGTTATSAVSLLPWDAAVIIAVPGATAVTRPLASTCATAGLALIQVIGTVGSESPAESSATAWSGHDPWMGSVAVSGCTRIIATTRRNTWTPARPGRGPPPRRVAVTLKSPTSDPAM